MPRNAAEVNKKLEENNQKNTYFLLDEIQADFASFEEELIPKMEDQLILALAIYKEFNADGKSIGEAFFSSKKK
jgi:K+/H+ antiporter YhaU regulatory subunit KhtT